MRTIAVVTMTIAVWTIGPVVALLARPDGIAPVEHTPVAPTESIRYDRDIRPILSDRCFLCHGPDAGMRAADLRLDLPESATAVRDAGAAIVPGDPEKSLVWQRLTCPDDADRMPPADSGKRRLTEAEQALIRRWIAEGAAYEPHWSFVAPQRPALPEIADPAWAASPIDRFILARLEAAGLKPSPEADRAVLLRRVFLDLTGLPPTIAELDAFLADTRPDAYERQVDRLLTEEPYRTRFAEALARPWLDQSRYADTCGNHTDAGRSIWLWRDWVLAALRDNMPLDRFIVEQLAGDLLPDATVDQKIATGFIRNQVTTDEGGAIDAEWLVEYAVESTNTTGSVFLGLTLGCTRCHDHKYDPITMDDYYGVFAFFNSIDQPGLYSQLPDPKRAHEPMLEVPTAEQAAKIAAFEAALKGLRDRESTPTAAEAGQVAEFVAKARADSGIAWTTPRVTSAESTEGATLTIQPDASVLASEKNPPVDEYKLILETDAVEQQLFLFEALTDPSRPDNRAGRAPNGNAVVTGLRVEAVSKRDPAVRKSLRFSWVWADIEQRNGDFRADTLLTGGNADRGWAFDGHNRPGGRAAVLLADEPFGYEGGTELHVQVESRSKYAQHNLLRVRFAFGRLNSTAQPALPAWPGSWYLVGPFTGEREALFDTEFGPEKGGAIDLSQTFADGKLAWQFSEGVVDGRVVPLPAGPNVYYIGHRVYSPTPRKVELSLGSDDGIRVFVNGVEAFSNRVDRGAAPDQDKTSVDLRAGENAVVFKIVNTGGPGGFYHRATEPDSVLAGELAGALLPEASLGEAARRKRFDVAWRLAYSPEYRQIAAEIVENEKQLAAIRADIPRTMVMVELAKPREAFVLTRGEYDKPDKNRPAHRSIPAVLGRIPEDAPRNRLGLAQWIVSEANPLTARVLVNRFWEHFFGVGIVATSEDFGMQGAWPSHPELLDWLAVEFREGGWDVRKLVREIVTSRTYRQASRIRPDALERDPANALLAYFPRTRLSAEQIRDQALYVSGLLVERLGGPSVKPYQPLGLWEEVSMPQSNTRVFAVSTRDEDLWRRSLYTYWKRAAPPPSLLTFDAPTREFCTVRRLPTNTPLQALVLWNDEQFLEAARVLAARLLALDGDDPARLRALYRACMAAAPDEKQLARLDSALRGFRDSFAARPEDAEKLLKVGRAPQTDSHPPSERAAWMMLANAVLAADATISKD